MKTHVMPTQFDGTKFAARYGLNTGPNALDFFSDGTLLHYPDSLPDEPIFDAPDLFVPPPAGIRVHTMKMADGKIGGKFIASADDSNCIHVVLNTESLLNDPWLTSIPMDAGSAAYCIDTGKQWLWNGIEWKKP